MGVCGPANWPFSKADSCGHLSQLLLMLWGRVGEQRKKIKQIPSSGNSLIEKFQGWPPISDKWSSEEGACLMG